jgi:hypothetical protein
MEINVVCAVVQMSVEMMRMTVENSISIAQSVLPNNNAITETSLNIQPIDVRQLQQRVEVLARRLFPFQVPVKWILVDDVKTAIVHTGMGIWERLLAMSHE